MKVALAALVLLMAAAASGSHAQETPDPGRLLDGFEDASDWNVIASDQVTGALRRVPGSDGKAICLDYDFHGVSGYVGIQKAVAIDYPGNYAVTVDLQGAGPRNDLQFKLVDASGENVWWVNHRNHAFPSEWRPMTYRKRHVSKAWGPSPDAALVHSSTLEFTLASGEGGKGSACFDSLVFRALPLADDSPLTGIRSDPGDGQAVYDLGKSREFGGAILRWAEGTRPGPYRIELSTDGLAWRGVREVIGSDGGEDFIGLPEEEARYLRVAGIQGSSKTLLDIEIQPLAFAATPNDFIKAVAARAPRGSWPRGFTGEQPYWTILGVDGGSEQGLIGEDGAIELAKGGFSIEPFVVVDGTRVTWADVDISQALQDGYLPIPSVHWAHPAFRLDITAFGEGQPRDARLVARYRLTNTTQAATTYTLQLRARPLQVNPPSQFLNTTGGVSPIETIVAAPGWMKVDDRLVRFSRAARAMEASTFASQGMPLVVPSWHSPARARDADKLASGGVHYQVTLEPGESFDVAWVSSLSAGGDLDASDAGARQAAVAEAWRSKLDQVTLRVPAQGQRVVDTLRTALAHMLISRSGPRLQPGTRSYARAWIRDGAMINEALLRLGREDVAGEFLRWYAPFQFASGKVPCCVDDRGSDPVPENDSHGELVFAIAEQYRYTRDRALLEAMWPHVVGAVDYMDTLRLSERTQANRDLDPAFYGLMPASISHEGYSAKPMHSYWDDFWALRGYKDAVDIAQWLGKADDARRFAASRDQFRDDLHASIGIATRQKGIDFIPGSAELGDFDATSTTIALAPGGEQAALPQPLLHDTFERYWREFVQRRDGAREWKDYTPYELRTVGTFVRLGWRERAQEALAFFFDDQQPAAWNQWAEVVSRTPRTPFFLGDLPHAWVASDYVRSALDLFAYSRESDAALVIAAGIPADWLDGDGVSVEGLRTPHGRLGYALKATGGVLSLAVPSSDLRLPEGGMVIALPAPWSTGEARMDGNPLPIERGELRIRHLPARVEVRPAN